MKFSKRKCDGMREAWHGSKTCAEIAREFKCAEITVRKFWEAERAAGRLPPQPVARPFFVKHAPVKTECFDAADIDEDFPVDDDDDSPIGGPMGVRLPDLDPLLMTLRACHDGRSYSGFDQVVPPEVLRLERKDTFIPSPAALEMLARARDRQALLFGDVNKRVSA